MHICCTRGRWVKCHQNQYEQWYITPMLNLKHKWSGPPDTNLNNLWQRFLIVERASENIPLGLTQFVIKKAIDGKRSSKKAEPLKSGSIFIEVNLKHQSQNHLKTKMLMNSLPVPHKYLISIKIVIQFRDLNDVGEGEIAKNLGPQGIIAVKQIFLIYICSDHQWTNNPTAHQYWLLENSSSTSYPQRCLQC